MKVSRRPLVLHDCKEVVQVRAACATVRALVPRDPKLFQALFQLVCIRAPRNDRLDEHRREQELLPVIFGRAAITASHAGPVCYNDRHAAPASSNGHFCARRSIRDASPRRAAAAISLRRYVDQPNLRPASRWR